MDATNHDMQWLRPTLPLALILISLSACSEAPSSRENEKTAKVSAAPEQSTPAAKLAHADHDALQAKATAACECGLAKGKNCWTDYRIATEGFRPKDDKDVFEAASACAPISTSIDCMKDAKGPFCLVTGYSVTGANLAEPRLCRQEEARALEEAFNAAFAKPGGNQKDADRAAKQALAAVRAGKSSKAPSTSGGCV